MKRFVLDCSVAIAWFFEDEFSEYSELVRQALLNNPSVMGISRLMVLPRLNPCPQQFVGG